jgi:hypothetical protein
MFQGSPIANRNSQSAHTLAEVMVAVLVLATMVVSLFAGFSSGFALVQLAREDERATQILAGKIASLRQCKWTDLTNYPSMYFQEYFDPPRTNDALGYVNTNTGALYVGSISISSSSAIVGSAPYANNMRAVTVSVQWTNFSGKNPLLRYRQMQTLVAQYGAKNDPWYPSR